MKVVTKKRNENGNDLGRCAMVTHRSSELQEGKELVFANRLQLRD